MIFSSKENIMITSNIKIGNEIILEYDFPKFLGIYVDNHLTFKHHILM